MRPAGPVGDLIFDLIECLFELKEVQQLLRFGLVGWPDIRSRECLAIRLPERSRQAGAPTANPGTERRALFGRYVGRPVDGGTRGIVDRAKESSDIARRRLFDPALVEALARLTLEVENVGVVLGDKDLTKMKIAVHADLAAGEIGCL